MYEVLAHDGAIDVDCQLTLLFAVGSSIVLLILGWLTGIAIDRHFEQQDGYSCRQMQLAQHAIARVNSQQFDPEAAVE